ncbi:hypothetical protein [Rhizobium ruizarguesonis]|jgi:hypothetical protein|uniref:hypothetical protein n=1 Tax=Rhizobium ruizarguesonis TaxID=2081791 RepID=UPI00102F75D6|nr:hypothetical protein [Rhizobium ruizarguesonis]TBA24715.1 hypothetical protein ELH61_02385 [Rhizobium ruizarguesonis]
MTKKVLVIDTSILCCLLAIPGKETCGSGADQWTTAKVKEALEKESNSVWVLPLASIIETGNHIAQAAHSRFEIATAFALILNSAANATAPWTAFSEQSELWSPESIISLGQSWPALATGGTSIGDATIKSVAEYYARGGIPVEIMTGDAGLKAYEPVRPVMIPRRRGR